MVGIITKRNTTKEGRNAHKIKWVVQQALKDSCQQKIKEDITKALDNSENISPKQHKLIVAYIAAHITYRNAQRLGVVQHMVIGEFENREETDDEIIWKKIIFNTYQ